MKCRGLTPPTIIFTLLLLGATVAAGERTFGLDIQRYPVGTTVSFVCRQPLSVHGDLWIGVGYNDADREDNGEFDDEQASGPGLSLGYRHALSQRRHGWSLGGRVDLWSLDVDWIDMPGSVSEVRGTTETLVLQPTAVVGRGWRPHQGALTIEASLAVGAEINIHTKGPDVGEGAIVLAGVSFFWGP